MSNTAEKALNLLRFLPRVCIANIRDNPGAHRQSRRGRAQHGGDYHGAGNKGAKARQSYTRLGFEMGNNPFYLRFPYEPYYKGHHLKRQYPPISLLDLQKLIDTNRIDTTKPIDLVAIMNTGLFRLFPDQQHFGFQLTDEGADVFSAKISLEIQWTTEPVIAAIERAGGFVTTAYYDAHSLQAMINTKKFFERGVPIPRRMMPPPDAIEYYSNPANRGYLSDPEKISQERLVLAQKYGYTLHKLDDQILGMLKERKDPRQIFYGLHPGWVVNLTDKVILKPLDEELKEYYAS